MAWLGLVGYMTIKGKGDVDVPLARGSATITASNLYVDVLHGLGVAPDVSQIIVVSQDDLGGRTVFVPSGNINSSTFRIQMSSQDIDNHVFTWIIVS